MSYSQSKKLTDTEKMIQAIKAQLYGKEGVSTASYKSSVTSNPKTTSAIHTPPTSSSQSPQTMVYLRQDLLKIAALAALAVGSEAALYFAFNSQVLTKLLR